MNRSAKKLLITGLIIGLLSVPFSQNSNVLAKEQTKVEQKAKQNELSTKKVIELANEFNRIASYIQQGGDYKNEEYKTFTYDKKTYRYLSSSIDTKKELKAYLEKVLVPAETEQFIKNRGIIEYKGKLAQVEADGGSLLQWEKATAQFVKKDKNNLQYRLTVPVWNTNEKQNYLIEYQFVNNKIGWKISKEPIQEKSTAITDKVAVEQAAKFAQATLYVQAGGEYTPGEYKTFLHNGSTYRYLSGKIDTKAELMSYLMQSMTQATAEQFIKDFGIVEYKGKLAQVEADGGSLAQWNKATAEFIKKDKNTTFYRVIVPIENTNEKQIYIVEYQYVENVGWRVSKNPYWELDIPGNVNPISILFNYLLIDSKVSQNQFLPHSTFNVTEFKKGIKKVEFIKLTETERNNSQVEFLVTINVEVEHNYKGPLTNGINKMLFTVQPSGYMEYKIDKIGIVNMY
ncbi:DL-endopeptidase inhibitor IseA family protein [Psychrobacillus sp. FJAT-51614]|uniref:DL-endopeptidase inhibitor IseA family protein n=1 Tax=Psychrobacillus mangrovi TaxID=3117745 RepID=A0ABU8F275_9BACI